MSDLEGDPALGDFSIEELVSRLEMCEAELDQSLQHFTSERSAIITAQKRAIVDYEAEMARIDAEYSHLELGIMEPSRPGVDHNIMKHLSLDKKLEGEQNAQVDAPMTLQFPDKKKRFGEAFLNDQSVPPPSFEEKRKTRERMFDYFEESSIEETQLELEIEKARAESNWVLVDELSESLLSVQRKNHGKLSDLMADYRPTMFGRTWGTDPDYVQLSRQLKGITDAYNLEGEVLPDVMTSVPKKK